MQPVITITHLKKIYDNQQVALENIHATLFPGRLIGLLGANGSGKSTLLHILAGIIRPTQGMVEIALEHPKDLAWVSQVTTLDWYLNIFDNVRLGARLGGATWKESYTIVQQAIEILQITPYSNLNVEQLSGGQQRRVQIARALAQQAEILLLDEPTTSLDYQACIHLMDYIKKLTKQGKTIIITSHDLTLLEKYIDQVWFLNKGKLELDQPIEEILSPYKHNNGYEIIIEYDGKLDDHFWEYLQQNNLEVLHKKPLTVKFTTRSCIDTNQLIARVLPQVKINAIKPNKTSLLQVYGENFEEKIS